MKDWGPRAAGANCWPVVLRWCCTRVLVRALGCTVQRSVYLPLYVRARPGDVQRFYVPFNEHTAP